MPEQSAQGPVVREATTPSPARITEIDVSRPARALALLRLSDYVLVLGCGGGALALLPDLAVSAVNARWADFWVVGLMAAAQLYAAYTGWRHVGVIDPRVWHSYLWVFPLLLSIAVVMALATTATWMSQSGNPFDHPEAFLTVVGVLQFAGLAIPGFVCVLLLRRTRIAPMGVRLRELLSGLSTHAGVSGLSLAKGQRADARRGIAYGIVGGALLLGATFAPLPADAEQASTVLRLQQQLNLLGFFLVVRARRYFQVSADSLLAVDKRAPILFLRSFTDDERQQYGSSQRALLDFSLEARLANHFHRFGPFIAIGSPKETIPQPGAARVLLSDDTWQSRVLEWMQAASVIIMYGGTTQWVNWELGKVIESGRATSLILMIPEIKAWRSSGRRQEIATRVEQIREAFRGSPWTEELTEFSDYAGLRAMLFRADGSMLMVRSRSRSRDAYHLAALIAHQQLLEPGGAPGAVTTEAAPRWGRRVALAGVVAAAALVGALYLLGAAQGTRLTFKQGELYYDAPVTEAEARSVGEYLVEQQFFSDERHLTVQLGHEEGVYRLRFVIDPALAGDPLLGLQLGIMGGDIAREALAGKPIEVALLNDRLTLIKVVPVTARLAFGKNELYHTDPVTAGEARAVGEQLSRIAFFSDDSEVSVHLGRDEDSYQLRFVIDPAKAADAEVLAAFKELSGAIAAEALAGAPIMVHLCDDELRTLRQAYVQSRDVPAGELN